MYIETSNPPIEIRILSHGGLFSVDRTIAFYENKRAFVTMAKDTKAYYQLFNIAPCKAGNWPGYQAKLPLHNHLIQDTLLHSGMLFKQLF